MQTDEGEFDFTPAILDTPSLLTPNIVLTAPSTQSVYNPLHTITTTNTATNNNNHNENLSISNPSSITTTITNGTSLTTSSADVKVSKIEDELKQSINEPRKPTPSPFQKLSTGDVFILNKPPVPVAPVNTNDDISTIEVPSTADVVKEIEALTNTNPLQFQTKTLLNDTNEVNVSPPKKKFLIRSQSHTEPTSPIPNNNINTNNINLSQSQKLVNNDNNVLNTQNGYEDENSIDDTINHHFTRIPDIPTHDTNQQFKPIIDNGNDQHLNIHMRPEPNNIQHAMIKQQTQPISLNNHKRTFQQANPGNTLPTITKANTIVLPPQPILNEVTSTDQLSNIKRQRTAPMPTNTTVMNFRPSYPSVPSMPVNNSLATNGLNTNIGSDDQRKKQIRDSNREAARRCRERRRQYIEQLEADLEHHKVQIKQLTEKLTRVERENTQLRAILSETKILHPSSRLSLNDSHVDYANIVAATGIDLNSESNHQTDGGTIQRNYLNRNPL